MCFRFIKWFIWNRQNWSNIYRICILNTRTKTFFERHENAFKRMKLHSTETFQEINQKITLASYSVSLEIAKQKRQHTIGETLIKPCSLKMVEFVLENRSKKKTCSGSTIKLLFSRESLTSRAGDQNYSFWHIFNSTRWIDWHGILIPVDSVCKVCALRFI